MPTDRRAGFVRRSYNRFARHRGGRRRTTGAVPRKAYEEVVMNGLRRIADFFRKLFLEKRAGPAGSEPDEKPGRAPHTAGGLETRCINPDFGCPFEVS